MGEVAQLEKQPRGAKWFRRRYYIEDGYVRPIPGSAEVPYDLFGEYRRGERSLWFELQSLSGANDRKLEDFCSFWGPLGILGDCVLQFWWPQQEGPEIFDRTGIGVDLPIHVTPGDAASNTPLALVVVRGPAPHLATRPVTEFCAEFFPDSDLTVLNNDDLRDLVVFGRDRYCERIEYFEAASLDIRAHAGYLIGQRSNEHALWSLNSRTNRVTLGLGHSADGRWETTWQFPSLLSMAYLTLMLDAEAGRILACANCTKPFSAVRPERAMYCSSQCREQVKYRNRTSRKSTNTSASGE